MPPRFTRVVAQTHLRRMDPDHQVSFRMRDGPFDPTEDPVAHRREGEISPDHSAVPQDIAEHDHKWPAGLQAELAADLRDILDRVAPEVVEGACPAPARIEVRVDLLGLRIAEIVVLR